MAQILMQFCHQKHNAWQYIVKQDHTGQDEDQDQDQKNAETKTKEKAWHDCQIRRVNAK